MAGDHVGPTGIGPVAKVSDLALLTGTAWKRRLAASSNVVDRGRKPTSAPKATPGLSPP